MAKYQVSLLFVLLLALPVAGVTPGMEVFEGLRHLGNENALNLSPLGTPAREAYDLGNTLRQNGEYMKAADAFFKAISLLFIPLEEAYKLYLQCYADYGQPAAGFSRIGIAYVKQGDHDNARNLLLQAIHPSHYTEEGKASIAEAYFYLSQVESDKREQIAYSVRAIELEPNVAAYHYNLGTSLFSLGEWLLSLESFRKCYSLDPALSAVLPNIVYLETRVCDWVNYSTNMRILGETITHELDALESALESAPDDKKLQVYQLFVQRPTVEPHMTLAFPFDPMLKLRNAKRLAVFEQLQALHVTKRAGPYVHKGSTRKRRDRIRVGYVSADFKLKATSYLLRHLFKFHDRDRFEVFIYATTGDSAESMKAVVGDWRREIAESVEHFVDLSGISGADRVQTVKANDIDILINMDGYSNNGIRDVMMFQLQVAPIQMAMIVYVGTLGADYIQYVITDTITSPIEHEHTYTEKFIHLPQSFFANVHAVTSELDPPSVQYTPKNLFTFCNFNKHLKISPQIFTLWLDALQQILYSGVTTKLLMLEVSLWITAFMFI